MQKNKKKSNKSSAMKTANIIGAGPAGCFLAGELAGKFRVNVYEEHKEIGKPVHCTGIATSKIKELIELPEGIILDRIHTIEINSGDKKLEIKLKEPDIVLDREKFEKYLFSRAEKAGAKFFLGHKLEKITENTIIIKNNERKITKPKEILIGADGPQSIVSKHLGNKNRFFSGIQELCNKCETGKAIVKTGTGKFCWKVPCKEYSKTGVMSDLKNAGADFAEIKTSEKSEKQGGLIPIYNPKEILHKKDTYIIGDAASLAKATTGGGIIPGLCSAKILADCLINGKKYEKEIKQIKKELLLHLTARKILDAMKAEELEKLISILSKQKNKEVLGKNSRDNLPKLALLLMLKNPIRLTSLFTNVIARMFHNKNL
jgi:flavin-dependent dehydrogenase